MKQGIMLAALLCASFVANAGDYVLLESPHDVATTVDRLEKAVRGKGLTVFARIDHGAGAARVDMPLAANEVLIFGSPKLGTLLMQQAASVGVDLPLKVSVWQDADGTTRVTYRSMDSLARAHGMDPAFKPLGKAAAALKGLTAAAIARD